MALTGEVINFVRFGIGNDTPHRAIIFEAGEVQEKTTIVNLWIVIEVFEARMFEHGRGAHDAMNFIAFVQQEFGQIGPILPRDAGDQRSRHGQAGTLMRPSWWALSNSMSASTIILTSSLKAVRGCHFSSRLALPASPTSRSTSAGRKYRGSSL